jgi:putative aminopeptidase FrvX
MVMPTKEEQKKFAFAIDTMVANSGSNYIEAIVDYCSQTGLEIEVASSLINKNLKKKIENEAADKNLLKVKSAKLPI